MRMRGSLSSLAALSVLALACASPVGVRRVDDQTAHRALTQNVLTTGELSPYSRTQLLRLGLWDTAQHDPDAALAVLRTQLGDERESELLFALAEGSFRRGQNTGYRPYFLAAVVYAYAFLFPETGDPPGPFDARVRVAMDLYNRALADAFTLGDDETVEFTGGGFGLPFGQLEVAIDPGAFVWGRFHFVKFTPLGDFEVRGLRNRYRRAGIGATLAGHLDTEDVQRQQERALRIPARFRVGVTAWLRIENPRKAVRSGEVRARLEVFAEDEARSVQIGGQTVPLEYEPTAALAYSLEDSPLWEFEIKGYISGDHRSDLDGLYTLAPHRPGRIPVILVHGTASSPARWAEMLNELKSDPVLSERYQFWLFIYNTGNPILYSASLLRDSLNGAVSELDPDGSDAALRRMVVIGHSQGGLLARLMATDSGTRFWDAFSTKPISELRLQPKTRELVANAMYFEPVPSVRRLIFISTPHRGSYLAGRRVGALAARLVTLPMRLTAVSVEVLTDNRDALAHREMNRMATSVDNMRPDHPFTVTLAASPIVPGVGAHSIVAVRGEGPPWSGQSDGVVEFDSAHLEGADSEIVVRSGHSSQGQPATIQEVRRILLEELQRGPTGP